MSNYHFREKKMSLKAKGLLSLMLSLPNDWNYSISGLVTLSKDGKDSVMTALAELEKFGYLKRQQLFNEKGQFSGVEYHIFEEPQKENPVAENANTENANAEKSHAEKRPQLNTNQLNTNKNKDIKELNTKPISESELYDILIDIENTDLAELYRAYTEWRATTDAPLTAHGLKMLIKRCERLSGFDVSVQMAMVETALIQGWKNVFAPKPEELRGANPVAEEHAKILFGDG
jgi:hypothetical protein